MMARKTTALKVVAVLAIVLALLAWQHYAKQSFTPEAIRDWVKSFGNISPLVYFVIYAIAPLLFFPGSVLTAAAGLIWGWKFAFLLVTIGANTGANLAFLLGRRLGQKRVQKLTAGKYEKYEEKIADAGFQTILFLRLVPLVPFNVLNYGAGVSGVRWRDYALGSFLGMIPGTFVYVYIGSNLDWRKPQLWFALAVLLLLASTPTIWKSWKRRKEAKTDKKSKWIWLPLAGAILTAGIGGVMLATGNGSASKEGLEVSTSDQIQLPAEIKTHHLDDLLSKFITEDNLVDYSAWKADSDAMDKLQNYVQSLAFQEDSTTGSYTNEERLAIYINAYNALTISTILEEYPVESIMQIPGAFDEPRHHLGNLVVSLDQIEEMAGDNGGYRVHAALVCAARSCPPFRKEAFIGERINEQLNDQMRQWLADPKLNRFEKDNIWLSSIFKWYSNDFEKEEGGLIGVLKKYGPDLPESYFVSPPEIKYLDYNWGLNDAGGKGSNYGKTDRLLDEVRKQL